VLLRHHLNLSGFTIFASKIFNRKGRKDKDRKENLGAWKSTATDFFAADYFKSVGGVQSGNPIRARRENLESFS
jgi:hypothetical protein